jgi:glutamate--cysteine ligase
MRSILRAGCGTRLGTSTDVAGRPARQRDGMDLDTRMDLDTAVRQLFAPARRPGRIGVEVELIPVTDTARPRPVDPVHLASGFDSAFVRAAVPTFEPGGQLELSPPPRAGVAAAVDGLVELIGRAGAIAAARGVRLEAVGTNPYHSCAQVPLRTPTPRYRAMQRMFDRAGPDGRRMMRLTASLQISVDLLPGSYGREQWLAANLAGPPLAAAFANSTVTDGRPSGVEGARTRIWAGVDLRRTGYDGRHLDPLDPIRAYAAFAAAAPRLPIPEAADPVYHLTTLFPPVRPRGGYLEVRYLDAQPTHRVGAAVTAVATLLYDRRARRDALDLLLPRAGDQQLAWREAARGCSPDSAALLSIIDGARRPGHRLSEVGAW